jgi:hypothetical protein
MPVSQGTSPTRSTKLPLAGSPGWASGRTTGIARQQHGQHIDPVAMAAGAAAEQSPGLPPGRGRMSLERLPEEVLREVVQWLSTPRDVIAMGLSYENIEGAVQDFFDCAVVMNEIPQVQTLTAFRSTHEKIRAIPRSSLRAKALVALVPQIGIHLGDEKPAAWGEVLPDANTLDEQDPDEHQAVRGDLQKYVDALSERYRSLPRAELATSRAREIWFLPKPERQQVFGETLQDVGQVDVQHRDRALEALAVATASLPEDTRLAAWYEVLRRADDLPALHRKELLRVLMFYHQRLPRSEKLLAAEGEVQRRLEALREQHP